MIFFARKRREVKRRLKNRMKEVRWGVCTSLFCCSSSAAIRYCSGTRRFSKALCSRALYSRELHIYSSDSDRVLQIETVLHEEPNEKIGREFASFCTGFRLQQVVVVMTTLLLFSC